MIRYIYLDWNVFNKIEHLLELPEDEQRVYATIEALILEGKMITPYSNAHINDLVRGYNKNPIYTEGHLQNIDRLTNSLCIVQYWGKDRVVWQYRTLKEFFDTTINDPNTMSDSFQDLFDFDETGLMKKVLELYRLVPVPLNFKDVYKVPIFNMLFPRTKDAMNMFALMEDIYMLSYNSQKDYSLFKALKTYINQSKAKLKQQQKALNEMNKGVSKNLPSHLNFDEMLEEYAPKSKTSDNPIYQKITDTYIKLDLRGHKSDDRFSNLIDDSLHVFYGAHCDYFITLDDKCHYKATETYHRLGIATKALKPKEFVDNLTIFISEQ